MGSEMCIRDRVPSAYDGNAGEHLARHTTSIRLSGEIGAVSKDKEICSDGTVAEKSDRWSTIHAVVPDNTILLPMLGPLPPPRP